jgi:hypothetical protein
MLSLASTSGKHFVSPLLAKLLVAVSLLAAAFAGGRAAVILTIVYPSIFLLVRKQFFALLIITGAGLLMLIGVRYTYDTNPKLIPHMVQRSVAMIPGMEMEEARQSIAGSSDWRYDLAMRALNEWRSNPRTTLLGRGVYAFTGEDLTAIFLDPSLGMQTSSLLRGATHNAITDHLLITGVVGLILYHIVLFTLLWGIYRIFRSRRTFDLVAALCLVLLISNTFFFISGFLGSGFFSALSSLLASMIIVVCARDGTPHRRTSTSISDETFAHNTSKYIPTVLRR